MAGWGLFNIYENALTLKTNEDRLRDLALSQPSFQSSSRTFKRRAPIWRVSYTFLKGARNEQFYGLLYCVKHLPRATSSFLWNGKVASEKSDNLEFSSWGEQQATVWIKMSFAIVEGHLLKESGFVPMPLFSSTSVYIKRPQRRCFASFWRTFPDFRNKEFGEIGSLQKNDGGRLARHDLSLEIAYLQLQWENES